MSVLNNLEPKEVFGFFEKLTTIPRGSGNTNGICEYLCSFAQERGLNFRRDEADNVIIIKPASPERSGEDAVILQGHTDMVCTKDTKTEIDFETDALNLDCDGEYVFAKGTSLGGDDGIAVAYMLALLECDISLPRLECIFTSDEEIGMLGAAALDLSDITGKFFINIDSEDEGVLTVSCAGGSTAVLSVPVNTQSKTDEFYRVKISGLKGGHSGTEINKGLANANKLSGDFLVALEGEYSLADISGGEKENAIAVFSELIISAPKEALENACDTIKNKYINIEPYIRTDIQPLGEKTLSVLDKNSAERIKSVLCLLPQGVIKMSEFDPSSVETSINLGVLEKQENKIVFTFSVRSSVGSEREKLEAGIAQIAGEGATLEISGVYPAWEYNPKSKLREKAVKAFKQLYGYEPKIESIHAGLECAVFADKNKQFDCISLGPDILNVHTANEKLSVASVKRTWEYLLKLLA